MRIITKYDPPPIPLRTFDWSAWDDEIADEDTPIGFGASEASAIADLKEQTEDLE